MHRLLSTLVSLAWALWFGGMVMLFIAVLSLFNTFRPDTKTAGRAAAEIFHRFERCQLALAAAALLATFAWWLLGARRLKTWLFVLFAAATVGAAVNTLTVSPRMAELRLGGETETAEFDRLHKTAEYVYMVQAVVLLVAGLVLPSAVRADGAAAADAAATRAGAAAAADTPGEGSNGVGGGGLAATPPRRQPVGSGSAAENS